MFKSRYPKLSHLKKLYDFDLCEKKYYRSFDFIDICEYPGSFKNKEIAFERINKSSCSVGYFHNGMLVRFDQIKPDNSQETYLLWKDGLVVEAHTYPLDGSNRVLNAPKTYHYSYQYDSNQNLLHFEWHIIQKNLYGNHGYMARIQDYEYDSEGLRYIYKTLIGMEWVKPERYIEYDREKERFLEKFTISKKPLVSRASKVSDGIVEFNQPSACRTTQCPECGSDLDYILTIHTEDIPKINQGCVPKSLPVLFCFSCLADQEYNVGSLQSICKGSPFVKDRFYRFVSTSDEEKLDEAFLKIGGIPGWIQNDEHPVCPTCGNPMIFVMEINSDESFSNGENVLMFGDLGKLYVFSCCDNIAVQMQST